MAKGEVVKVDEEPVCFRFWMLCLFRGVFLDIEFGRVNGFCPAADQDIERE